MHARPDFHSASDNASDAAWILAYGVPTRMALGLQADLGLQPAWLLGAAVAICV
jgi:hypothetical protein